MDELTQYILNNEPAIFTVRPEYFDESDSLMFFTEDCPYYAQRIDELLTVFFKISDNSPIGVEIKGVKHLINQLGNFGFTVTLPEIDTRIIFAAYMLRKSLNSKEQNYLKSFLDREEIDSRMRVPDDLLTA